MNLRQRKIYINQCRHRLFEKLGAVVDWDFSWEAAPEGIPHVQFWLRRLAKCCVYPLQRVSFFYFFLYFSVWKVYNKGRYRDIKLNNSRWY